MLNVFKLARRSSTDERGPAGPDPLAIRSLLDDPQLRELMMAAEGESSGRSAALRSKRGRRHVAVG